MHATPTRQPGRRWRPRALTGAVIALLAVTALTSVPSDEGSAALLAKETFNPTPGPLGPVTVIGDSVMLGSVITSPTMSDHLAARGWGPIRVRAGGGYTTGKWNTGEARASYWINLWRQYGWDPVDVVVNLGGNDSGFCGTDFRCAYDAIVYLADTIGPGHRIWWSKSTHHWVHQDKADNWNAALDRVASERDDFFVWDWPTVMEDGNFPSSDNIHLSPDGYRRRSETMAYEVTADLARGTSSGASVDLPAPAGPPSELIPIDPPTRIIDTREDPPGYVRAGTELVIDVSDEVPTGATAVAAYVSATDTGGVGFLTAYECSAGRPFASSANYRRGDTRGAVAIVPVSPTGTFCLYTEADAHLLVDLQAAFVPNGSGGLQLDPLDTPDRLVDTRDTGAQKILEIPVPAGAEAVSVSVTAIAGDLPGYLTAYPCSDEVPFIATVNHGVGEVVSGAAFVPVSPDGTICVLSNVSTDVTVDLTGIFAADGALGFVPVPPTRMLDTRTGIGGWSPVHGATQTIDARVAPANAAAVSGTITMVNPMRWGFLQAWGCGQHPPTANVTSLVGDVLANSVTTSVSPDGRLCIFAHANTGTLFDTTGWWVTTP